MECVRLHLTSINLKQKTTGRGRPVVIKAFMLFTEGVLLETRLSD